jgi:hypothetical protein
MAHCRRKFVDVIKASENKAGSAQVAMSYITKLYHIEGETKEMSHGERYKLRPLKFIKQNYRDSRWDLWALTYLTF